MLLLGLLGATASCHRRQDPNVLVIAIGSLRPDRLGAYGNQRGLTPFIDQLAQQGTVFLNAFSTSSATTAAVASLMTSRDPRQHLVATQGSELVQNERTFAEVLQANGYRNSGFSADGRLQQRLGFSQGFVQWQAHTPTPDGLPAAKLRTQGMEWLTGNPTSQPTLLYFHFVGPSQPYLPPEPFRARFLQPSVTEQEARAAFLRMIASDTPENRDAARRIMGQLYDGEVAAVDDQLRQLCAELSDKGFLERAIIILTSDHGEELLEHGEADHGRTLFDESVRIPLLVIAPGFIGGRRVEDNVSLLDVAPTLIDLVGVAAEPRWEGQSLLPFLEPDAAVQREWSRAINRQPRGVPRDILLRLDFNGFAPDQRTHRDGLRRWTQKLLVRTDGTREVYDLAKDPAEQVPNPPGSEGIAQLLAQALDGQTILLQRRAMVR